MARVVYPGTFDPISLGHINLIKKARALFSEVIVAVSIDNTKKTMFTKEERYRNTYEVLKDMENVDIRSFRGLVVDFIEQVKARAIIRGIRTTSDFNYELQMANMNKDMNEKYKFETIFLVPDHGYEFLSSTAIREIAKIDPYRAARYVHPKTLGVLIEKLRIKNNCRK